MLERHGQLPPRSPVHAPNAFGTPAGKPRPGSASAFSTPVGRGQGSAPPLTPAQQQQQQQALVAAQQNASRQQGTGPVAGKRGFPAPPPAFGRPGQLPVTPGAGGPYSAGPQEQLRACASRFTVQSSQSLAHARLRARFLLLFAHSVAELSERLYRPDRRGPSRRSRERGFTHVEIRAHLPTVLLAQWAVPQGRNPGHPCVLKPSLAGCPTSFWGVMAGCAASSG